MKHKPARTILVAISSAHAASRQKLRGIYRYAAHKDDWDITIVRSTADLSSRLLCECTEGHFDGIILSSAECSEEIARAIPQKTPLVAIESEIGANLPRRRTPAKTAILTTDNVAIGHMVAEHFRSLGHFNSYVYVPDELGREWSNAREKAFMDAAPTARCHKETYANPQETLAEFLVRQKQPVAVFAAWDFIAAKVIKACHESGLSVPSQVSVIGVDDDDMICESVRPPLSTILVDRVKQGFIAAKTLNMMMNSRTPATNYICRPLKVVERESTTYVSQGRTIIERARKFINDHVKDDLDVQDVADALHISRRLLDLRFAESEFGSVAKMIRARRLSFVKRFLKKTSLSDSRIAVCSGFKNVGTLRNLFRRTYGMSMRTYRAQCLNA